MIQLNQWKAANLVDKVSCQFEIQGSDLGLPLHISSWYRRHQRRTCLRKLPPQSQDDGYCSYQRRKIVTDLLDQVVGLAKVATRSLIEFRYPWALSIRKKEACLQMADRRVSQDYQYSLASVNEVAEGQRLSLSARWLVGACYGEIRD